MGIKVIKINKKASHRYIFIEKFEAGIMLQGSEVKSLRANHIELLDSYATIDNGQLYLVNCHIAQYPPANLRNHEPTRRRKLLLHRNEIDTLAGKIKRDRLTLVPTRVYFKEGRAKIELALAKGKHQRDRRDELKKKAQNKEIAQAIKHRR